MAKKEVETQAAEAEAANVEIEEEEISADPMAEAIEGMIAPEEDDVEEIEETPAEEPEAAAVEEPGEAETPAQEVEAEVETEEPAEPAEAPEAEAEVEAPAEEAEPAPTEEPVLTAEPEQPPQTPEELAAAQQAWREETVNNLAKDYFALDEETAAQFGEEAAEGISRLQAKTYLTAVEGATHAVAQILPQMISQISRQNEADAALETAFFSSWPKLNKTEHGETIQRLALSYRQANPGASADILIRDVGAQAMVALKLPFDQPDPSPEELAAAVPPVAPVSAGRSPAPRVQETNPFALMVEDVEEEEQTA